MERCNKCNTEVFSVVTTVNEETGEEKDLCIECYFEWFESEDFEA